jgi:hypothetical protein
LKLIFGQRKSIVLLAAHQVRTADQSQDGEANQPDDSPESAGEGETVSLSTTRRGMDEESTKERSMSVALRAKDRESIGDM